MPSPPRRRSAAAGDGKSTFAHTPSPRPGVAPSAADMRWVSQRSIPRVGTATTSRANGSCSGAASSAPSASTSASARSARWTWSTGCHRRCRGGRARSDTVSSGMGLTPNQIELHGHRVSYRPAGSGPALLLLHGVTNSSATWERVAPGLSRALHADRAGPAWATAIGDAARRLFTRRARQRRPRRHDRARDRARDDRRPFARRRHRDAVRLPVPRGCERLVLVFSGGLGREVHLLLRAATLPGRRLRAPAAHLGRAGRHRPPAWAGCCGACTPTPGEDMQVLAEGFASLDNAGSRQAFLHTVRAVIEPGGQRVSAERSPRAGRAAPVDDRVGGEGLDHPGRARHRGPRGDAREPLRGLPRRRPHAPQRRPRALPPHSWSTSAPDRTRQADRRSLGYGDPITVVERRARPHRPRRPCRGRRSSSRRGRPACPATPSSSATIVLLVVGEPLGQRRERLGQLGVVGLLGQRLRPVQREVEVAAAVVELADLARRRPAVLEQLARSPRRACWPSTARAGCRSCSASNSSDTASARNSPSESQRRWFSCTNCCTCLGAEPPAPVSNSPPPFISGTIESIFALVPSSRIGNRSVR